MLKNKWISLGFSRKILRLKYVFLTVLALVLVYSGEVLAKSSDAQEFNEVGTIWLLIASALVFFMNAGFAMLETGMCRQANAVNVLSKNLIVFCVATLAFWLFGFRFMFGDSENEIFGQVGLLLNLPFPSNLDDNPNPFPTGFEALGEFWTGRSFASLFFFQLVFAGTAATIVSGAVAERIKFWAFIAFSFVLVGLIYPFTGYWIWGGGWLSAEPFQFRDFAGSTVVHSVGGMAALAGAWLIQPREGKFGFDPENNTYSGKEDSNNFKPFSLGFATLGCLVLWLGWFGFNGGSTPNLQYVPHIIATTLFAAASGGVGVVVFSPFIAGQKANLSFIINGILGGLVGITASSAYVDIISAGIIGVLSGIFVLMGENLLKFLKIDDPVGAVPVHLVCGFWGTIAVGFFASEGSLEYEINNFSRAAQVIYQFLGWASVSVVVGLLSIVAWILIGLTLHYLEEGFDRKKDPNLKGVGQDYSKDYGFLGLLIQFFEMGRKGMRVSLDYERAGGDPTLL